MKTRLDLQHELERRYSEWNQKVNGISDHHVYFQSPGNTKMIYPCILYSLDTEKKLHADNLGYKRDNRYKVTIIDKDPDSTLRFILNGLQYCSFDRVYISDNLYHYVFTLFY